MNERMGIVMERGRTVGILLASLLLAAGARSEPASGDYAVNWEANPYLWDISGTYHEELGEISVDYTVNLDSSGKCSGTGTARYDDGADYLEGSLLFNGSVRSAGNVVRVNLVLKLNLSGQVEGYDATVTAIVKENVELDPATRQLVGSASGKATVSVPGLGKQSGSLPKTEVNSPLPPEATGGWELSLSTSTNGTKYAGNGTLSVGNGRSFPLVASGAYSAKTDSSKLVLKGIDLDQVLRLSITATFTNDQMTVRKLSGKALGQNLQLPARK